MIQKLILIVFFLTAVQLIHSQESKVRGKIAGIQPNTNDTLALAGAVVSLYIKNADKKWESLATTITNGDGIYFFEKVKPGTYFIQVNKKKNFKVEVLNKDSKEVQDLPLIIY